MKKYTYSLILSLFFVFPKVRADSVISFFFQNVGHSQKTINDFRQPGALAHQCIACITRISPIAGIMVTYKGHIAVSDYNGEITLPRKHQKPSVKLLVTEDIVPVFMFFNTVHHWELIPGKPSALYSFERKHDASTGLEFWDITTGDLPEDNIIDYTTVIIMANPKDISIEPRIEPTIESPNLILPPITIKKGIDIVKDSIHSLDIRFLFRPVGSKDKKESLRLTTHAVE